MGVPSLLWHVQLWLKWIVKSLWHHIDGLAQDCSNSIAKALELLQSCTKPSIWCHWSWSSLPQVMACCLMTLSHYQNQCWLFYWVFTQKYFVKFVSKPRPCSVITRTTKTPAFWDTPRCPMITHTGDSHQIPSQNKTKLQIQKNFQKYKFLTFAKNFTRDTPSEVTKP